MLHILFFFGDFTSTLKWAKATKLGRPNKLRFELNQNTNIFVITKISKQKTREEKKKTEKKRQEKENKKKRENKKEKKKRKRTSKKIRKKDPKQRRKKRENRMKCIPTYSR